MTSELLHEPWASLSRERQSAVLGMWLFVATEILFFGGLFAGYAVYRLLHSAEFVAGARDTEIVFGGVNTAVLLASSCAMAIGVRSARASAAGLARRCFLATALLGIAFLVLKGCEYSDDISKHLVPGHDFAIPLKGAAIFWTFYWAMTGVHTLHLLIGVGVVLRLWSAGRNADWLRDSPAAEVTGLYWHFVDAIWVFLFPLLYLAGRAS